MENYVKGNGTLKSRIDSKKIGISCDKDTFGQPCCIRCGWSLSNDWNFCPHCGSVLIHEDQDKEEKDNSILEYIKEFGTDVLQRDGVYTANQYVQYRFFCDQYDYPFYYYDEFVSRMRDVYTYESAPGQPRNIRCMDFRE